MGEERKTFHVTTERATVYRVAWGRRFFTRRAAYMNVARGVERLKLEASGIEEADVDDVEFEERCARLAVQLQFEDYKLSTEPPPCQHCCGEGRVIGVTTGEDRGCGKCNAT